MEIYSDTLDDRKIRFAVIAIETAAKKLGVSPSDFCARLDQYDLIEKRLFKFAYQIKKSLIYTCVSSPLKQHKNNA